MDSLELGKGIVQVNSGTLKESAPRLLTFFSARLRLKATATRGRRAAKTCRRLRRAASAAAAANHRKPSRTQAKPGGVAGAARPDDTSAALPRLAHSRGPPRTVPHPL